MEVSFQGIGEWAATFMGGGLQEGQVVKPSGSGAVALCGDGEDFCGVVRKGGRDACCVQLGGLARVACSGTVPPAGFAVLAGDGKGGVKTVTTGGQRVLVVASDKDTVTIRL